MNQLLHPASVEPHPFLRVFCAVALPADVRACAAAHIEQLRKAVPEVRASWERTEKMHITLKFVGEIEERRVPDLSRAAAHAAAFVQPFHLTIEEAGVFPLHGQSRVLWLGVKDSSSGLTELQRHLEDESAAAGFPRDERPFHSHLTIARLRTPAGARKLAALHQQSGFKATTFPVTELLVIRSELGPGGSRYTTLSSHLLGTGSLNNHLSSV